MRTRVPGEKSSSGSGTVRLPLGMAVGAVAGLLVDVLGVRGLALLIAVAVGSAFLPPRFTVLGAVLVGAGGFWLPFTVGAVMLCAASPSSCSSTSPVPYAIVAACVLIAGVLILAWTRRRPASALDIQER